jgi:ribosomal protein S27E
MGAANHSIMNFAELKEIIKYIKKAVSCSNCGKKLADEDITVLFTYGTEALLHVNCGTCKNQLIVHITVLEQTSEKSSISITTAQTKSISQNDVLEIHTFLNQFNGDFEQLFTEQT